MNKDRFFSVVLVQGWRETPLYFQNGKDHKEIASKTLCKNKRITNDRFREIETTGNYYRITEQGKGGKSFIFELI